MFATPIGPADFEFHWRPIRDRIFSGAAPDEGVFRDENWPSILLPSGPLLSSDILDALSVASQDTGPALRVVAGYREEFDDQSAFITDWEADSAEFVATSTVLGHIDVASFDGSANWGLFISPESFTIFGGLATLTARVTDRLGGVTKIRRRFLEAVEQGEIGFRAAGREFAEKLLKQVGW